MLKIFAGYDPRVPQGFEVFRHSVERHASGPVAVIPLDQEKLRHGFVYARPPDSRASTPFSLTRFLVPRLCDWTGMAFFFDGSDMLMTQDIFNLLDCVDLEAAISCVQHEYHPNKGAKFFGQEQRDYPRKNWSSVMVFNCERCTGVNLHTVDSMSPSELHQFCWTSPDLIGSLPIEWNWLAGEDEYRWDKKRPPALIHYTLGLPIAPGATKTQFDDLWFAERQLLIDSIMLDPSLDHAA